MNVDIKGNKISYDGRKESLLVSYISQNFTSEELRKKIDDELLRFASFVPSMKPEHLVVLRWQVGYEFGNPMDYYGIGAIACNSVKPWKYHETDHLIQHRNPFAKIRNTTLLDQISLDYISKTATLIEGNDSFHNYYLDQEKLEKAFKKAGFKCEYSKLAKVEDVDVIDFL